MKIRSQLEIPVIAAPMFLVSGTQLLIACSKNGILGTMPALNARTSDLLEAALLEITTALTKEDGSQYPYGINLIVHKTNTRLKADLALCVKYKVPVVITSLGAVKDVVDAVHSYGGIVLHDVIKLAHAQKAIDAGVDGLIAVCNGAGGHAGTLNPFAFLDALRKIYKGYICLAGCINKGAQIKAAELMGANAAYMGTRFIATQESLADNNYKNLIVQGSAEDIIYTDAISGVHASFLKTSIENAGVDLSTKGTEDFSKLSEEGQKAWKDIWSAGQGIAGINNIPTVAELVRTLKQEYLNC